LAFLAQAQKYRFAFVGSRDADPCSLTCGKPESDHFIGWKHDSKTQLNLKGMKNIVFLLGSFSHHFRFEGDCVVPFPYKIEAYQNQP
jgi:hypothetical protein